ncbi:cell adhesion molecule DSCAM-like [Hetaerina americana]|uniref:cell adhesion molecule DSCAM-like n=1 Tax=Hetaerina americana TaxID=62018 RepID=UPI003A7F2081
MPGREISSNGSLIVLPFHPTQFRPSVHAAPVRCRAANHVGVILSRECKLKPDLTSDAWQPSVVDVYVAEGNVAVLHCDVSGTGVPSPGASFQGSPSASRPAAGQLHPSAAGGSRVNLKRKSPVLRVAAWLKEHSNGGRTTVHPGGRYTMTKRGSLHIQDVSVQDGFARFFCQAVHRLTGQRRTSPPARIFVKASGPQLPPRIDHFLPSVKVRTGQATDLVCAAQGNPPPMYRWYKEYDGSLHEIHSPGRDSHPSSAAPFRPQPKATVLHFPRASPSDAGPYVCTASSATGEDRRRVYLEVAGGGGGSGGDTLEISLHPQQVVADAGSPISLNCTLIGGVAARKITWLKDGQPLLSADPVSNRYLCCLLQGLGLAGRASDVSLPFAASAFKALLRSRGQI